MRAKHWIAVALFVAVVASAQAYAVVTNSTQKSDTKATAAEVETPRTPTGPQQVVSQEAPAEAEDPADGPATQSPTSNTQTEPETPRVDELVDDVTTLIVGFKQNLSAELMKAIVLAAGATPTDTVSAPGTLVVSVDKADLDETVEQLESHILVDYVAVPAGPHVTGSL